MKYENYSFTEAMEVLANRATEILGGAKGEYICHPNDHVNCSQSTNDVIPTAGKLTVLDLSDKFLAKLEILIAELENKAKEFDGIISGVTNFGVFVELENGVEGLVKAETLSRRRLEYDEKNFTLADGKKKYKLGQAVKIEVVGVNLSDRRAEFILLEDKY